MDRNTNRNTDRRSPDAYSGRFGSRQDAASRRPTGSYRSRPAGSYRSRTGYGERRDDVRRPSMRDGGDSYTRRPEPRPEPETKKKKASAPNKRGKRRSGGRVLGIVALCILALLLAALVIVLLLDDGGSTVHMLPSVERI